MERSEAGTKGIKVSTAYHFLTKFNNNKHNILVFYKIWKKSTVKFTKKMDLNNRKITNLLPLSLDNKSRHSPRCTGISASFVLASLGS